MVARLWFMVEMVSGLLEWPFIAWQLYIVLKKQENIQVEFDKFRNEEETKKEFIKRQNLNRLTEQAEEKTELEVEEDFYTLTVFSYLKVNSEIDEKGWGIKSEKQSQLLYSCIMVAIVAISMQVCMLGALWEEEEELEMSDSFLVFYVKLPCAIALHFCLYPEVAKGMNLMKFANNQSEQFVQYGAEISYFIGFIQVFTALVTEYINISLLVGQTSVELCIIHFVALEVIMEIASLYFESLLNFKIKSILEEKEQPKCINRSKDIHMKNRSTFHKFARVFYKTIRAFYVSVIFYYVPFMVIFGQWQGFKSAGYIKSLEEEKEEGISEGGEESKPAVYLASMVRNYFYR